jgi:hypothetical protein
LEFALYRAALGDIAWSKAQHLAFEALWLQFLITRIRK